MMITKIACACLMLVPSLLMAEGFQNIPRTSGELLTNIQVESGARISRVAYHAGHLYGIPQFF